ncbi:MAG: transcription termination/antitermination NusG family protein [Verrucomicrobiota bacterium]|nr:transcription termination/antitermination NusG family protein [Verrucomicrobiota bacterium]
MNEIIHKEGSLWCAAKTKPRCEKKIAQYCDKHQLCHYLPLRKKIKRYKSKTTATFLPLFPGYLFIQISPETKTLAMHSHKIVYFISPDQEAELQLIDELNAIQKLQNAQDAGEMVLRPEIKEGNTVILSTGPFAGLSGIVTRRDNKQKITINIELIGQSVTMQTDIADVELD